MKLTGRNVLALGLTLGAGIGIGTMVEGHTNEVAEGKIITVDTCMKTTPHEDVVTQDMIDCFADGVPGGNKIGKDKFDEGDPIEYVEAYRTAQVNEASSLELGRLAIWSILPIAVGGAAVFFEL